MVIISLHLITLTTELFLVQIRLDDLPTLLCRSTVGRLSDFHAALRDIIKSLNYKFTQTSVVFSYSTRELEEKFNFPMFFL